MVEPNIVAPAPRYASYDREIITWGSTMLVLVLGSSATPLRRRAGLQVTLADPKPHSVRCLGSLGRYKQR